MPLRSQATSLKAHKYQVGDVLLHDDVHCVIVLKLLTFGGCSYELRTVAGRITDPVLESYLVRWPASRRVPEFMPLVSDTPDRRAWCE